MLAVIPRRHDAPARPVSSPSPEQTVTAPARRGGLAGNGSLSDKTADRCFSGQFAEELELEIGDIAQSTGMTVNAVNVNLFRAVRSIRKRLRKQQRVS